MATLKDIRRRIRSVQSTQQITRAMQMVAAAKLRRAHEKSLATRPYATRMNEILTNLSSAATETSHPLFEVREPVKKTIVVVASDKGLCGSFNTNVFRHIEEGARGLDRETIDLVPVGRRAALYFGKRGWQSSYSVPLLGDQVDFLTAQKLARHVVDRFVAGVTDRVDFVYTRFITTGSRRVVEEKFLPIAADVAEAGSVSPSGNYIYEPDAAAIFGELLPRYVQTMVMSAMADSLASEHAARLISMTAATKNAGEMIQALTLTRNKLRQAAITKEISELVGGAEALS